MKVCRYDPFTEAEVCDFRKVKKRIKQMAKQQRSDLQLRTASLYQMCKQTGHPEYFWSVRARIVRSLDSIDLTKILDGLFVNPRHLSDLRLSDTGIACFREILDCYLNPELVDSLYVYLHRYNDDERALFRIMQTEPTERLKGWLRYYEAPGPRDDHIMFADGVERIKRELQRRKEDHSRA